MLPGGPSSVRSMCASGPASAVLRGRSRSVLQPASQQPLIRLVQSESPPFPCGRLWWEHTGSPGLRGCGVGHWS